MQAAPPSELRDKVREAYSAAADSPTDKHPFPVGRAFAESLGYPVALLDTLPSAAVEAFAGVSNVSLFAEIPEGATVLDLGCGAGLDSLIAARRVGPSGKVIGVDFSDTMLGRARKAAQEATVRNVSFEQADAERLPLSTASIDVALVNGIFNLNPARESIFRELARVLQPGGVVYAAELILAGALPANPKQSDADWLA
ncbi:MAG TPA: methyltransferase domain-containing protein [Terriglobales bacterium]|nr:methyltransferase domain-containing protein [Terriglobales bacterium]